jgi:hypothetical protein
MILNGGKLINAGPLTWGGSGQNLQFNNGTFTNLAGGTVTITADVSIYNGGFGANTFGNAGLLQKTGGTNTTDLNTVALVNSGRVSVDSGTISCTGGYNLKGGTLDFGINSLASFGKINLPGAAALTGTVAAHFNGGYSPIGGNSFAVLTYGSSTGIFTNTALPSGMAWQTNYAATTFTLTVLNVTPTLVTLTPISKTATEFLMQVTGPVGPHYILQANDTLGSGAWVNLLTNTPVASPFSVTDTNASAFTNRFYRVNLAP